MNLIFRPNEGHMLEMGTWKINTAIYGGFLKVEIKRNQENLVKPHCKESYLLSPGSFLFRVLSFLVSLILLLKFSKHEIGSLGNRTNTKNGRPRLLPPVPASQ